MARYRVVAGRVLASKGDIVEMEPERAKRFGHRLEEVKKGRPPKNSKQQSNPEPEPEPEPEDGEVNENGED